MKTKFERNSDNTLSSTRCVVSDRGYPVNFMIAGTDLFIYQLGGEMVDFYLLSDKKMEEVNKVSIKFPITFIWDNGTFTLKDF